MKKIVGVIIAVLLIVGVVFLLKKPRETIKLSEKEYRTLKQQVREEQTSTQGDIQVEGKAAAPDKRPNLKGPATERYLDIIAANMVSGGPPKDGIPAIDNPVYVSKQLGDQFLKADDIVYGVDYKEVVKAFPQKILYWHEIVNDEIKGEKVSVTYCPLTGTTIGYRGKNLGVSGNLYNSNLVMYDRKTDSKIPQILGIAATGPLKGEKLTQFHITQTTWEAWKKTHPNTLVLSPKTGYGRDYERSPYPGYEDILRVWFPLAATSDKFNSKEVMIGIELPQETIAVPKKEIKAKGSYTYKKGDTTVKMVYDKTLDAVFVESNKPMKYFDTYWFAWYAYHPDTKVILP